MQQMWEECWRFETASFVIVAEHTPCDESPVGQFDNPDDIEAIRDGNVYWFDARVRVLAHDTEQEIGADYLSCCAYYRPEDLFRHHASLTARLRCLRRLNDPASWRERRDIRATLANNIQLNPPMQYCEYGPDMVRQAVKDARRNLQKLTVTGARLRAVA